MGSPRTDGTGQIQKASDVPKDGTLYGLLKDLGPEIGRALPKHLTPDRMARVALTALRTVPDLARCTRESFAGCIMQLAQLGLEPNTPLGHAYLIPRRDGKKSERAGREVIECTMIIGYQGFLDLGRRAGVNVFAHAVKSGDDFRYELGLHPVLRHVPSPDENRESQPITHVYAVARTKEFADSPIFVVLSRAQVNARKARSATAGKGFSPWKSDEEAMFLKTAVRALWRWMPKQIECSIAEAIDDAGERGELPANAFDPAIADVLQGHGLMAPADDSDGQPAHLTDGEGTTVHNTFAEARQGQAAIVYDKETGEVR